MNERRRFLQVIGGTMAAVGVGCGSVTGAGVTGGSGGAGTGGMGGAGTTTGTTGTTGTTTTTTTTATTGTGCGNGGASNEGSNHDFCFSNAGVFDVGKPTDYATNGLYKTKNAQSNVLVGRDSGGFYAMSSLCTHQCCDMNSSFSGEIFSGGVRCLCHGSQYDLQGNVVQGPAFQGLTHHPLALGCDGTLYVDTTKNVPSTTRLAAS